MVSSGHRHQQSQRPWLLPAAGIALLALGMLIFAGYVAEHWDTFSRRYAAAAFALGILPQLPAIGLLLGLGRSRNRDEATFAQSLVAFGAGGIGLLFLAWAAYLFSRPG